MSQSFSAPTIAPQGIMLRAWQQSALIIGSILLCCGGCAMLTPTPSAQTERADIASAALEQAAEVPEQSDQPEQRGQPEQLEQAALAADTGRIDAPPIQPPATTEAQPTPVPAPPVRLLLDRLLAGFSFPDCSKDPQALIWESWYQNHPDYLERVFRRAEPWLYMVMAEIEARELPMEFALLPVIESAYDVFALSPVGAHGAWQITVPTAQDYGLSVRTGFDGRRDMVLATRAAATMLQRLMQDFDGNWRLALAAYNGGPARVARAARKAGGKLASLDPARLALPRETKTFAPKLHGLVCLLRNQHAMLPLPDIVDRPAIASMHFDQPVDLIDVAHMAEIDVTALYTLNAGLSSHLTPPSGYALKLPVRHLPSLQSALAAAPNLEAPTLVAKQPATTITVQSGDTLGAIARRHQTTVQALQQLNRLSGTLIRPGQVLQLSTTAASSGNGRVPGYSTQLAQLQQLQRSLPGIHSLRHRIGRNETLSTIARRYRVSVAQLQQWNNIRNPNRIRAGQTLQIHHTQPAVASSSASAYRVQSGDSLWTIARRFRVSLNDLMRWNQLSGNSVLRPGQLLQLSP